MTTQLPAHEYLPDGSVRVRLLHPYEHGSSGRIAAVLLVRPKAKHMVEIGKVDEDDGMSGNVVMISQLGGLPVEAVSEMDLEDVIRCVKVAGELLGKSMRAGGAG